MSKKNETPVVETEEMKQKFQEKLIELLALGKKKKNMLEYQEINDFFKDMPLEVEKMELVLDYLEHNGIDVLRISEEDDDDAEIILSEEDDVEVEKIDLDINFRSSIGLTINISFSISSNNSRNISRLKFLK